MLPGGRGRSVRTSPLASSEHVVGSMSPLLLTPLPFRRGQCRMRFHAQARYEEFGGNGYSAGGSSGIVSNLLSSFLPFRKR